jgi:phage-related tail fiber protein
LRWRDLYLSGNTIDMDGVRISANASGLIVNDGQLVPPGTVIYLAGSNVPTGYLEARGQAVSRSVYNRLFGSISTIFGVGDGSSTFTLPDLRGEFIRGWDNGRGVDSGRGFGNAQSDDFKSHLHGVGHVTTGFASGGIFARHIPTSGEGILLNNTASTGTTETRPRNISLFACIKV